MSAKLARERATDELINNILPQVKFAEELKPSVTCFLCHNILRYPMQISCGHRLCKTCNETLILPNANGERRCPEDDEVLEKAFPDGAALKDVMNMSCFCLAEHDGCPWTGLLMDLEIHMRDCEFFIELKCPYFEFQCNFKGSRATLTLHLQGNSIRHDCLLATSLREILNKVDENSNILNSTIVKTQEIDYNFTKTQNEIALLQEKIEQTSRSVDAYHSSALSLNEGSKEFMDMVNQSRQKKELFEHFYNRFKELKTNVEKQIQLIDQANRTNREGSPNPRKSLLSKAIQLEDANKSHEKQINDFGVKIRIYQCSSNDGSYTWKLDNLAKRMAEAGKVSELYTPPLYTSPFGYKYSAKVMLNGDKGKGIATHIAFYIVIMQGDFDEILKFPFPYPITVTLINKDKKRSIVNTLFPDPNKEHFQKPFKSMNPSIGFAKFISHDNLNKGGFIKDDAIYFQINVDKVDQVKEPNI